MILLLQLISLFLIAGGIAILIWRQEKINRNHKDLIARMEQMETNFNNIGVYDAFLKIAAMPIIKKTESEKPTEKIIYTELGSFEIPIKKEINAEPNA